MSENCRMEEVWAGIQNCYWSFFFFFLEVCQRLPAPKVMLMGMLIANCPLKQKESIPVSLATTTTTKSKEPTNLLRISLYNWIWCINLHLWQIQRDRDDNKAQTAHMEVWFWAVWAFLPVEAICLFTSIQTNSPRHTIDTIHFSDGGGKLSAFHPTCSTLVIPTLCAKYLWLFWNNGLYWRKTSTE